MLFLSSSQKEEDSITETILSTDLEQQHQEQNFTVTFPSILDLRDIRPGDFIASPTLRIKDYSMEKNDGGGDDDDDDDHHDYEFRVLLYPRGGGHSSSYTALKQQQQLQDGGIATNEASDIFSMFQRSSRNIDAVKDRVGVYLQYLPKKDEDNDTAYVDATFNLRLKGRQSSGPRFDVDWTAGMRFVPPDRGSLRDGTANDFGAHMMQSYLLEDFLGGENSEEKLCIEVKVKIHGGTNNNNKNKNKNSNVDNNSSNVDSVKEAATRGLLSFRDIREMDDHPTAHNTEMVRVGKIVVPIIQRLSQRPRLFELGAYPGVEYRIMRILHPETGEDIFDSMPGCDYELKPIYPLVRQLERQWPVRVNEKEIPKLYTMNMYNAVSAIGSLLTAVTGLTTAFIISQLISLFFIPSKSMDPTLRVGDVLLVEKVSNRILKSPNVGDVVLFNPNNKLQEIVKSNGGKISDRDLFVKRVAAGPGDYVSVDSTGRVSVNGSPASGKRDLCEEEPLRLIERYVQPVENLEIKKDEVFVLGDCSSVSVDSRVWGPLNKEDLVGRPILRIWPFESLGSVPAIPSSTTSSSSSEQSASVESMVPTMMATDWTD